MSCLGVDMSVMTTMIGTMADGPHKREMYGTLAAINIALSGEGTRGCDMSMLEIMRRMGMMHSSKMAMMKSGM